MGKGVAHKRTASSADVIPMNIGHTKPTAYLVDWEAPEYTDVYDNDKVMFDEVKELSSTVANAIGRRDDQTILDAALAGKGNTVVHGGTNLTVAKLRAGIKFLNKKEVPKGDRYMIIEDEGLDSLLGTTEITSSDYNSVKALVQGEVDTFLGIKFICIGEREEGGLSKTGNIVSGLLWHKDALGHAIGLDKKPAVDWIPTKSSHLINSMWTGGAVAIDPEGIVEVQYDIS